MSTTTIQVTVELKAALAKMRLHPRESFNDVVDRLLEDVHELDKATLAEVESARLEIRAGKYVTQEQVRKALGL